MTTNLPPKETSKDHFKASSNTTLLMISRLEHCLAFIGFLSVASLPRFDDSDFTYNGCNERTFKSARVGQDSARDCRSGTLVSIRSIPGIRSRKLYCRVGGGVLRAVCLSEVHGSLSAESQPAEIQKSSVTVI
jgi:hypothetical protein